MNNKITHSQINFALVKKILEKSKNGANLTPFTSEQYPNTERRVAMAAFMETQLIKVAFAFKTQFEIMELKTKKKMPKKMALQLIEAPYKELDIEDKYEMMPLFFSPDMVTKNSIYIDNIDERNLAYKAFQELLKRDSLDEDELKKNYLRFNEYSHLLPLNYHVENGNSALTVNENAGQTDNTEIKKVIFTIIGLFVFLILTYYYLGLFNGILIYAAICFILNIYSDLKK